MDQGCWELIVGGFWTRTEAVGERELEIVFQGDGCTKM